MRKWNHGGNGTTAGINERRNHAGINERRNWFDTINDDAVRCGGENVVVADH